MITRIAWNEIQAAPGSMTISGAYLCWRLPPASAVGKSLHSMSAPAWPVAASRATSWRKCPCKSLSKPACPPPILPLQKPGKSFLISMQTS